VSRSPESPLAATLESVEAKLAYADAKGEIRVHALESGEEHLLAGHWMMETPGRPDHQARLRWPTWSPNGNRIAVEGLSVSETGIDRALLWIVSADGIRAEAVEELPPAGLVYLQWQPDGAGLLHLTAIGEGRLRLARAGSSTSIAEGAPLFLSALAGGKVAAHVFAGAPARARLLLVSAVDGEARSLTDRPGGFRAPCLLSGGTLVFTVRETDHERLAIWGPERGYEELPVAVQGRVALLPEASGSVLVASGPASEAEYQRLERLQGPPWHTEPLLQTPFSAVFPLPDGRVGFVTAEDSGAFSWRLLEGRERSPFELLRFVPTEEETLRLGFFDQYHGSHSPIAPDGHALVVAGVNVRAPSLPGEPQLYCVPLDGSGNPRALGAGRFAVWAPGPTGGALGPPTS
jgi:hypothetical protein